MERFDHQFPSLINGVDREHIDVDTSLPEAILAADIYDDLIRLVEALNERVGVAPRCPKSFRRLRDRFAIKAWQLSRPQAIH